MYFKDSNDNDIPTTLYESYLSKAVVEAKDLHYSLITKINHSIQKVIKENSENEQFQRKLFSVFSLLNQKYAGCDSFNALLENYNIYIATDFHKLFFELFDDLNTSSNTSDFSLASKAQSALRRYPQLFNQFKDKIRPENIFKDHRSGRKTLKNEEEKLTQKFGIALESSTTPELRNYFEKSYLPGQNKYRRDQNAAATKWLKDNNIPFVSGLSGTIGVCYCGLLQLNGLSPHEIRDYLMILAATLVARGHHSFGEFHLVLRKIGFAIEKKEEYKQYYEQFLTPDFISSDHYESFLSTIDTHILSLSFN